AGAPGAASRAAAPTRFAGRDRRHRVAGLHADRVHHPGHDLGVGVDVRSGDVAIRADDDADLARVAAGEILELVAAEILGVDDDATLGATVRNTDHGALPRHPHSQRFDFLASHARVVADPTLGGAAVA